MLFFYTVPDTTLDLLMTIADILITFAVVRGVCRICYTFVLNVRRLDVRVPSLHRGDCPVAGLLNKQNKVLIYE
jgi:hypothetical protein